MLFTFSLTLVGYNMEVHYCDGEITGVSNIGKSQCICDSKVESKCEMECGSHDEEPEEEEDCCETQKIKVASSDKIISSSKLGFEQVILLSTVLDLDLFESKSKFQFVYDHYEPPSLVYDIPISIQSFLI